MAAGSSTTPHALDVRMWRRLKARCHPDTGGDEELFVWLDVLYAMVEGQVVRTAPGEAPLNKIQRFINGCLRAHAEALAPLVDWWEAFAESDESDPATPKQVAYIARLTGMTDTERYEFYDVCGALGLTKRMASFLIEEHKSYGSY